MRPPRSHSQTLTSLTSAVVILIVSLSADSVGFAQSQDEWPPISQEELDLKDNSGAPGSSAMILLKKDFRDHRKKVRESYYRIKILTEKGREYADIEISYGKKEKVENIAARTIQPDGRIIEFRGAIFDKSLVRGKKVRLMAKTFTMPEVQAGSMIEYRYRIKTKEDPDYISTWFLQEPLFIREAQLRFRPRKKGFRGLARRIPLGQFRKERDDVRHLVLRNIPALEEEAFMPPLSQMLMRYHILYDADVSRFDLERWVTHRIWDFIGKPKKLKSAVRQLTSPSDNPREKLEKLYEAVQAKIRNLSYEESYSKKERKREKLKKRKSAFDVWKHGYGTADEITRLFVGLCRTAGLRADIVLTSQRDTHFFDDGLPYFSQLDGEIALIQLGDGLVYLDPGTRLAPFGWVSWENQGVIGYQVSEDRLRRGQTARLGPWANVRNQEATVEVRKDGSARVQLHALYTGGEAVELRNDLFELSQDQRRERLREKLESRRFEKVTDIRWEGLDDARDRVEVFSTFQIPSIQPPESSRIVIRPVLFPVRSPFAHWKRKFPVYLPEAYCRIEKLRIILPPGYELELGSDQSHFSLFGSYDAVLEEEQDVWVYTRTLNVNTLHMPKTEYSRVKQFFDLVSARDQLCLVFKRGLEEKQ